MDKALQNVIKHDQFVESVGEATGYISANKKKVGLFLALIIGGLSLAYAGKWYFDQQRTERQLALGEAMGIAQASTSRTAEEEKKVRDAFEKVIAKYPGTREAALALYMTAMLDLEKGDMATGEKKLKEVMAADKEAASLAKFTMAELLAGQGKTDEAEKTLRELVASPTYLMPVEQSTLQLGRLIAKSKPEEARKLLEPLRTARAPISTPAIEVLGALPPAPAAPPAKK